MAFNIGQDIHKVLTTPDEEFDKAVYRIDVEMINITSFTKRNGMFDDNVQWRI